MAGAGGAGGAGGGAGGAPSGCQPGEPLLIDRFERMASAGWGTPDWGTVWSPDKDDQFSVFDGEAHVVADESSWIISSRSMASDLSLHVFVAWNTSTDADSFRQVSVLMRYVDDQSYYGLSLSDAGTDSSFVTVRLEEMALGQPETIESSSSELVYDPLGYDVMVQLLEGPPQRYIVQVAPRSGAVAMTMNSSRTPTGNGPTAGGIAVRAMDAGVGAIDARIDDLYMCATIEP